MINTPLAPLKRPLYGQCTKKGLGTINKEKTREIECFARRNFSQAIKDHIRCLRTEFEIPLIIENRVTGERSGRIFYYLIWENGLVTI